MSQALVIITYGGGDLLREFFNAIVLSLGDDSFKTLMRLSLLLAGVWALVESIASRNVMLNVRFICLYILITSLLFVPKTSIEIVDQTQGGKIYAVDGVPLGLAVMANITSVMGDSLTQLMEKNFTLPDDLRYSKTGMVMASSLVTAASQFQITDPVFSANVQSYVEQCVFYDLLLHKYSQTDLLKSSNVWQFLKDHSSPARAFLYKNKVTVCDQGILKLDEDWTTAIDSAAANYSARVLHGANAKANLLPYLQTSYQFLTQISDDGAAILKQNLIASSISQGLQHWGASTNATAALESYAFNKAQTQKRLSNQTVGDMAAYWLPLMKFCFEGILYGAFIFVFLLALFPFGLGVLRNYLAALMWVQLWAPLYAMINLMVSFYARGQSTALVGGGNLTLSAIGGLAQVNSDMAGLAGYLSLSVPILAWGIVKGMGSSLTQLAQFVGGTIQSAVTATAAEAATGNISLGNTHLGNHSQFNTNANHWDMNARYAAGMSSIQTPEGATLSLTPDGTEVMDQRGSLSNLGVSIHMSERLSAAATTQAQTYTQAAWNETESAGQHYSAALRGLSDWGHQQSQSTSSGHTSTQTLSGGMSRSATQIAQLVDSFAKEQHVSTERAGQVLGQVYGDIHRKKGDAGLFGEATLGGSFNVSLSSRANMGQLYNEAERFIRDQNFSQAMDTAERAAKESHYRDSSDQSSHAAQSIASNFEQAEHFRKEASSHFSKAQSFTELASQTQENAASIDSNYTQAFYEWMREQPDSEGHSAIDKATHDPALLQSHLNRFVQQQTDQAMASFEHSIPLHQGEGGVQAAYQQNNQNLAAQNHVQNQHQAFDRTVDQQSASLRQHPPSALLSDQVGSLLENNRAALDGKENTLSTENHHLKEDVKFKVETPGKVLDALEDAALYTGSLGVVNTLLLPKEKNK